MGLFLVWYIILRGDGSAAQFDSGDYIDAGADSSLNLGSTFTLSAWAYVYSHDVNYEFLITKDGSSGPSYDLGFKEGKPYLAINDGSWAEYVVDETVTTNEWHHIVGVRNIDDTVDIYIDGIRNKTFSSVKTPQTVSTNVVIGRRNSTGYEFVGLIDEVRIWNKSFLENEIYFQYASNLNKLDSDSWELYINQSKNASAGLVSGTYTYFLSAKNDATNENITELRSIIVSVVDDINPTLNIISPTNNSTSINNTLHVTYSAVDDIGLDSCWYSNDSMLQNTTLSNCANITGVTWSVGQHNVSIWVNDTSGNENSTSLTFTINSIYPKVDYGSITPINGSSTTNTSVELNFSIIEDDLDEIKFNWNGTNYSVYDNSIVLMMNFDNISSIGDNDSTSTDLSQYNNHGDLLGNAGYNISGKYGSGLQLDGEDDYMNLSHTSSLNITGAITISLWERTADIDVTATWGMSIFGRGFYGDPRNTMDLRVRATGDTAVFGYEYGSGANSDYAIGTTDITDGNWHHIVAQWNGTDCLVYVDGSYENSTSCPNAPGPFDQGFVLGKSLNSSLENQVDFNGSIDELIVWNRSLSAEEIYQQYVSNLRQRDVDGWSLYINQSKDASTGLDPGNYTYYLSAKDSNGYENITSQRTIIISTPDSTNPIISIIAPTNNTFSNDPGLNLTYLAEDTNIGSCFYSNDSMLLNTTLASCANITGVTWSEGEHNVTIWVNDTSGNENNSDVTFTVDTIAPSVIISNPMNTTYTTNPNLNINFSSSDENTPESCWYSNDSMLTNTSLAGCANITGVTWSEGEHNITIWVNDTAGNENSSDVTFTVDTTAPSISIVSPVNNSSSANTSLNITFDVSDSLLDSCWYSNDSMLLNTTLASCANITSVTWGEGEHNVSIWTNDTVGNQNSSDVTFTIDTIAPTISISSPVNTTNTTNLNLNINYSASDADLSSCWYSNDSMQNNLTLTNCANITDVTWAQGEHNITIWTNDTAGNENNGDITFTLDSIVPTFSNLTNQSLTFGSDFNYTFTTNDSSGISCFDVNDSSNFQINCSGFIENITALAVGEYQLNITVNDTFGNNNSELFLVNVTPASSLAISLIYPTADVNASQHEYFNVSVNVTCLNENCGEVNVSLDPQSESSAVCGADCNLCNKPGSTVTDSCDVSSVANCGSDNTDGYFFTNDITVNGSFSPGGKVSIIGELDSDYGGAYFVTGWQDDVKVNEFGCYDGTDSYTDCNSGTYSSLDFANNRCNVTFGSAYNGSETATFAADSTINVSASVDSEYHFRVTYSYNIDCASAGIGNGYTEGDGDYCEVSNYGENDGLNISLTPTSKIGLISTTVGDTPFYTNTSNPQNLSLSEGESSTFTWWVNATAEIDTVHEFFVYANLTSDLDIANESSHWNLTVVDTTAPYVSIASPTNIVYTENVNEINYNHDDLNAGSCWYSTNNGLTNSSTVEAGDNFTSVSSSEGENTWFVYCNDSSNNIAQDSVTFTKNIPTISLSLITPTTDTNVTQNETFTFSVDVGCNNADCGEINVSLDPIDYSDLSCNVDGSSSSSAVACSGQNEDSTDATSDSCTDGSSTEYMWVENIYVDKTEVAIDDTVTVTCEICCYSGSTGWGIAYNNGSSWEMQSTGTCTDGSGVSACTDLENFSKTVEVDDIEGDHSFRCLQKWSGAPTNTCNSGTYDDNDDINITVAESGKSGLISTVVGDTPFYTNGSNPVTINLNNSTSTTITWTVNATGDINTTHEFFVYANKTADDSINNETTHINLTIVDYAVSTPPTISISTPTTDLFSNLVSLNINFTASDTDLDSCWYSNDSMQTNITLASCANITSVTWSEGQHNVSIWVNDSDGNEDEDSVNFTIDTINPLVDFVTPSNNSRSIDTALDLTHSISDLNLATCWYSNDSMLTNTTLASCANITTITWSEGEHNVTVWANDSANNQNESTLTFTVDSINPSITINSPINSTNTSNSTTHVSYTVSDANLASCWYSNDSMLINTTLSNCANITSVTWSEGEHNISIWVNDSTGNENSSDLTFRIDSQNPSITILSPTNNTNTSDSGLDLSYFASDEQLLASCWYSNDSMLQNTTLGSCANITSVTWSEGEHNITVWTNDSAGNENNSDITFTIDLTAPTITIENPTNSTNSTNSAINVNYTVSDSSLATCWYSNDSMLLNTTLSNCANITSVTWSEGDHNISIWANDSSDNVAESSIEFSIDTLSPSVDYDSSTINNGNYSSTSIDIVVDASDTHLETITINLYNSTGLVSSNSSSSTTQLNVSYTNLPEGTYTFNVTANDTLGNSNSTESRTVVIDTSGPALNILGPVPGFNSSLSDHNFSFSIIDDLDASCILYMDEDASVGNITVDTNSTVFSGSLTNLSASNLANRTHAWYIECTDTAGNSNSSAGRNITVDQNAPTIVISSPQINQSVGYLTYVSTEVTEDLTSIDSAWYYMLNSSNLSQQLFNSTLNETGSWDDIWNTTHLEDIEWDVTLVVYANDSLSNTQSVNLSFFLDNVNPVVQFITPTTASIYHNSNFTLNIPVQDSTLNYTYYNITNSSIEHQFNSTTYETSVSIHTWGDVVNVSGLADGTYTITAYGEDEAANSRTVNTTFIIDATAPVVSLTDPTQNEQFSNSTVLFNWTASDNIATEMLCDLLIDSTVIKEDVLCQSDESCSSTINNFVSATYTWNVSCSDNATNVGSAAQDFIIDLVLPAISFESPTLDSGNYSSDSIVINVSITDDNSNTTIIELFDVAGSLINSSTNSSSPVFVNFTNLPDGTYFFNATTNDTIGNTNSTRTRIIEIDSSNPTISINAPSNHLNSTNNSVHINYTVSDVHLTSCWYSNDSMLTNTTLQNCANITTLIWSEGEHNLTIWANDTNGNENSSSLNFRIDTSEPTLTVLDPSNNSISLDSSLNVTFTASDPNLDSCWYSNDSMLQNTTLASCANITTVIWSEGEHNVSFWANDSVGNINTADVTFTIDLSAPSISIATPNNNSNHVNSSLSLTFDAADSNLESCWYSNDSMLTNTTLASCANITSVSWSEGQHNITIWANDTAGNINNSDITFNLDITTPTISFDSPENISFISNSTIHLNYTSFDTNIASCWYSNDSMLSNITLAGCSNITSVNWSEGVHNVRVWVNDTSGNENHDELTFTVDISGPIVSILSPSNTSSTTNVGLDITHSINDTNLASCWYSNDSMSVNTTLASCANITDVTWSNGEHNVTIWANDSAGNENNGDITFSIVVLDLTEPNLTLADPVNSTHTTVTGLNVTYNVADDYLDSCWYSNDSMLTNTTLGSCANITDITWSETEHNISIWANDTSGNLATVDVTFTIDTTAPTIAVEFPTNSSSSSNTELNVNYSAIDTNLASCWYNLDSQIVNTTLSGCSNITGVTWEEGQHNITFWVNDTAGNIAQTDLNFTIDLTNPSLTLDSPVNTTNTSNPSLNVNYTVSDNDLATCWYSNDSMSVNTTLGSCADITGVTWSEGEHNVTIWANDSVSNQNATSVTFTIDTKAPSWSNNGTNISVAVSSGETVVFNVTFNDSSTDSYIFSLYNGSVWHNYSAASFISGQEVSVTNSSIAIGIFNWTWYVNDSAGNTNQTDVWEINVTGTPDTTDPIISFIDPTTNSSNRSTNWVYLNVNASDTNLENITLYLFNSTGLQNSSSQNTNNPAFNFTNLLDGDYLINATANDTASNLASTDTRAITIDTRSPAINISSVVNSTNTTVISLDVNFDVSDIHLATCWYSNDSMLLNTTLSNCGNLSNLVWSLGQHNITVWANDSAGNLNSSSITFTRLIDVDEDGFEDVRDNLLHYEENVTTTGLTDLNITVGGNNSNGTFDGTQEFVFYDDSDIFMNFSHNFTQDVFDLSNITFIKTSTSLVVNLSGQLQDNKTLFVEDNSFITLCVKDAEVSSISEVSSGCDGDNETDFTSCIGNNTGVTSDGITCTDEGSRFKIDNLEYSAVKGTQAAAAEPSSPSASESSGGGGGGGGGAGAITGAGISDVLNISEIADDIANLFDSGCSSSDHCAADEVCYNSECVKVFDVKILEVESPIDGNELEFTYYMIGMADINDDVTINFYLRDDANEVISSGQDVIFLGSYEEKTESAKIFIPRDVLTGSYQFYVEVGYGAYSAESFRTVYIENDGVEITIDLLAENITFLLSHKYWVIAFLIMLLIILVTLRELFKAHTKIEHLEEYYEPSEYEFDLYDKHKVFLSRMKKSAKHAYHKNKHKRLFVFSLIALIFRICKRAFVNLFIEIKQGYSSLKKNYSIRQALFKRRAFIKKQNSIKRQVLVENNQPISRKSSQHDLPGPPLKKLSELVGLSKSKSQSVKSQAVRSQSVRSQPVRSEPQSSLSLRSQVKTQREKSPGFIKRMFKLSPSSSDPSNGYSTDSSKTTTRNKILSSLNPLSRGKVKLSSTIKRRFSRKKNPKTRRILKSDYKLIRRQLIDVAVDLKRLRSLTKRLEQEKYNGEKHILYVAKSLHRVYNSSIRIEQKLFLPKSKAVIVSKEEFSLPPRKPRTTKSKKAKSQKKAEPKKPQRKTSKKSLNRKKPKHK